MTHFAARLPRSPRLRHAASLATVAFLLGSAGCATRPQAPILELPTTPASAETLAKLDALLPTDVLLVGEQHDAAEHHKIEQQIIAALATRGQLAAVALEMADVGLSTAKLTPGASPQEVQRALKWDDKGWPWAAYGPVVMTAVRASVPVLGANLPRDQMATRMRDASLDMLLSGPALKGQQQAIRIGHCNELPESQIAPMTRIQIAKDITMAATLQKAALPGKVVVLLSGNGHVDRLLGVPLHLPASLKTQVIHLRAAAPADAQRPAADAVKDVGSSVWLTPAIPEIDYCASLRKEKPQQPQPPAL